MRLSNLRTLAIPEDPDFFPDKALVYLVDDLALMVKFYELVSANLYRDHSMEQYAEWLGISRQAMTRKCKAFFGCPSELFVAKMKAKRVVKFLHRGLRSNAICQVMNFKNPHRVRELVKRHYGKTPTEIKSMNSNHIPFI